MKRLRQAHLYLGCLFTPMIIYFSLSGVHTILDVDERDLPRLVDWFVEKMYHPALGNKVLTGFDYSMNRKAASS